MLKAIILLIQILSALWKLWQQFHKDAKAVVVNQVITKAVVVNKSENVNVNEKPSVSDIPIVLVPQMDLTDKNPLVTKMKEVKGISAKQEMADVEVSIKAEEDAREAKDKLIHLDWVKRHPEPPPFNGAA